MRQWGPWKKLGTAVFLVVAVFAGRGVRAAGQCDQEVCGDGYCAGYPCETDMTCPYDCAVGSTCWSNSDCPMGKICMNNQCQPGWQGGMCFTIADCYADPFQECKGGYCVPGGGGGGSWCNSWWDCPPQSVCWDNMCVESPKY